MQRLVLPWLLDAIRQYQLRSASAWLRGLYRDQLVSDRDLREEDLLRMRALLDERLGGTS